MKRFYPLAFFACIITSYSQTPAIQWQKCLGGTDEDDAYSIKQTHDKGFIVAGSSKSNDGDVSGNHSSGIVYEDFWVAKIDSLGTIQWQKSLGGTSKEVANSVCVSSNGDYVIAGYTESTDGDVTNYLGGVSDTWVVCLDSAGNLRWQKTLGGPGEDGAQEIQQTSDKGFVIASWSSSPHDTVTNHDFDYYIAKLDSAGTTHWEKYYGGSGDDTPYSICQTTDGKYIVSGYSESNDLDVTGHHGSIAARDCWIIKLDSAGNLQWEKSFGGTNEEAASCIRETIDGDYIFTGWSSSTGGDVSGNHGSFDIWTVRIDTAANIIWQQCYGGSNVEQAYGLVQTPDKGFAISGVAYSTNGQVTGNHGGPNDYWLVKTDSAGNLTWEMCMGGSNWEASSSLCTVTGGGYALTGITASSNGDVSGFHGGNYDYWVVKLKDSFTTGVNESAAAQKITLYPNPANDKLFISSGGRIGIIKIYNSLGELVLSTQCEHEKESIDVSKLANGAYILRFEEYFAKFLKN
jgi:hypothetical protein